MSFGLAPAFSQALCTISIGWLCYPDLEGSSIVPLELLYEDAALAIACLYLKLENFSYDRYKCDQREPPLLTSFRDSDAAGHALPSLV